MKKKEKAYLEKLFPAKLLKWDKDKNLRKMPWKGEKNPYKIWLSEIILQQTRVEQGIDYYNRFIKTFPDIHKLAKTPDHKIFKLWEGLGYYSRCRNLIETARHISNKRKGEFPANYEEIRALKGIGPYTAAAISSFAFNLPYAVVDGNVFRVLSRVFGITVPIDSSEGKKHFTALAKELLDKQRPGRYNQAIMDFGATVCKPVAPLCLQCPFRKTCSAFINKKISSLPVKEKKIKIKVRWFYFLVIELNNKVVIRQRTAKDIWQHLYEFPLIETGKEQDIEKILLLAEKGNWLSPANYTVTEVSGILKQQLSHQLIQGKFIKIKIKKDRGLNNEWEWADKIGLTKYAFPKLINSYFQGR
jgi:A/G-specific adenine glycosylase